MTMSFLLLRTLANNQKQIDHLKTHCQKNGRRVNHTTTTVEATKKVGVGP